MTVEYVVVSAPRYEGLPTEDAYVVSEEGGAVSFFAVVADGHGGETLEDGSTPKKSKTVAQFSRAVAESLATYFRVFPDPVLFEDHFDATAENVDSVFRSLTEREHQFALLSVGSTATALTLLGNVLHVAHAGDSRLYRSEPVRGYRQLIKDHTITYPVEARRLQEFSRGPDARFLLVNDRDGETGAWGSGRHCTKSPTTGDHRSRG